MIGSNETAERFRVEMTVSVRDQFDREGINPRIIFERGTGEFGQFTVITSRQVLANLADLFFDDVKIIDQPFGSGRDYMLAANGLCQRLVSAEQLAAVFFQPRQ